MAKKPKRDKGGKVHPDLSKGRIDKTQLHNFVRDIEAENAAMADIMAVAQQECEPHQAEIKSIYKQAATAGIPKQALKAKLRERSKLRAAEKQRANLNEKQQGFFDEISELLEDFDDLGALGAAATRREASEAAKGKGRDDDDDEFDRAAPAGTAPH